MAVSWNKDARKVMCQNNIEENKRMFKSMKNKAKKAASKAVKWMDEEALTELKNCPIRMFRLVRLLKTDSKEVGGKKCMR